MFPFYWLIFLGFIFLFVFLLMVKYIFFMMG